MSIPNGKIGRLPPNLREQLNQRLEQGEPGGRLLEWVKGLPAVRGLLARDFAGEPISAQNLSNWRGGGYQHWLKQQDRRALVRQMTEDAADLDADAVGVEVANHWSALLLAELAVATGEQLATITDPAERCTRLQELLQTLVRVRREDYRSGQLQLKRELRARDRAEEERLAELAKENEPFVRSLRRSHMADHFAELNYYLQAMGIQEAETILREAKPDGPDTNLPAPQQPETN